MTRALLDSVRAYRRGHAAKVLADFAELLALDNVTGDVPALHRNAAALAEAFTARGARMQVVALDGVAPVVVGRLGTDPARPTLGVYVHYDGQPVGTGDWRTPPFEPTLCTPDGRAIPFPANGDPIDDDWRIYARAAADDKAPFAALLTALDALHDAEARLAVNLVLCFEGEEESGSAHLRGYLQALRDQLRADAWLVCDGPVHHSGAPQIVLGVRGFTGFDLTVYGPLTEIHSGHYGNWAPNPALDLVRLLATCKDDAGTVTVDGFYDTTRPVTPADVAALQALPEVEPALLQRLGLAEAEIAGGRLTDQMMRPSFNLRGLSAGDVGAHARNAVPAHATASVDIRLAAGDEPDRMLRLVREHVARQGFHVLDREPTDQERRSHRRLARFTPTAGYPAVRVPADLPIVARLARAATEAAGREAVVMPTLGGSLPLHDLVDVLAAPTVILPIANADNNQHAANENLRVGQLWYGVDLWALLLTQPW
ncbi:peptidase M20 [Rhizocola hellebori]|uniref:Peptidase M20 n=1 Tax=Rhizocola hellebori TaxID=1392758 RepID=A0A8J3Q3E0_9ACTN|nr:M20/M25/M40 family metallo-hydrolase [Rhizocola hellebori]GIH02747.1 peptidase M20 [Rhizocola hellebori]